MGKITADTLLKKHWGYTSFRPLQKKAIDSLVDGQDALVVLPTGGGKSLCFQIPALLWEGITLVVSPLISLMKDQVDSLVDMGISAARWDSTLSTEEYVELRQRLSRDEVKLLYLSPERLLNEGFMAAIAELNVSMIAVDESHCVSLWGHDFRPDYRKIKDLRKVFPDVPFGAFTATATPEVRSDICTQLELKDHVELIGSFDRPNLTYRVLPRKRDYSQVLELIRQHPHESGIIYCLRRKDTEDIAKFLTKEGFSAAAYHAGLNDSKRKKVQEDFLKDEKKIVAATIAFGMGINKIDVRFVIHMGLPKSPEHYQQEAGRAGRDGLEAHCTLLYSGSDMMLWRSFHKKEGVEISEAAEQKLNAMYGYAVDNKCRHQALSQYFGETLEKSDCGACDVCLGELPEEEDSVIIAKKIISCVYRLEERYGADYTAQVLMGSRDQRILDKGHIELSTYGLLREYDKPTIRNWIEQLVSLGFLIRYGEYKILQISAKGWDLIKNNETVSLVKPHQRVTKKSAFDKKSWEGVDRQLFDELKQCRTFLASEAGVPPYVIFSDATLRDMARRKPKTPAEMLGVHGVGEAKLKKYGEDFLVLTKSY